uniref:Tetratricopeptide repeat protein n=1 Tax=uncultured Armatimonadetes bacterium TaxID=157466 RepID=A0A6J4H079_9BACT|nr:hypothetical protein AVDCRST_MAG63-1544 [uncultured Armatimonadetes bacterium]
MKNIPQPVRLLLAFLTTFGLCVAPRIAGAADVPAATAAEPSASPVTPLFEGMGKHKRKITTKSPLAQRYFDQGLNFLYAFNHDEAIRSFTQAAAIDPGCAMAYWGIATANGPHINFPLVPPDRAKAAWQALTRARELAGTTTPVEKALIETLGRRYADPQPEDRKSLDEAYAAAMRDLWKRYPNDADIGALFAEAMMDLRPWDLWTPDGKPQPGTPEVVTTLEKVLARSPYHPLALHLYIHAVEASTNPGRAAAAADRLRNVAPGLGHLVHMPSHIDVRLGKWQKNNEANRRAIEADRKYTAKAKKPGFYRLYMAHNRHMLAFGAMMQGESRLAREHLRALTAEMPADWKQQNAFIADGFHAMPYELMLRFGQWEALLAEPEPPAYFPIARALRHAARGVAYAALGKTTEARASQAAFREAVGKTPPTASFGNNAATSLFAVAEPMLEGEILFKEGKQTEALAALRTAVAKEDQLRYSEPPDWIQPVRHALGATLMQVGEAAEAEQVYREDLRKWPENGWSLFGLAQSLEAQNKREEAARVRARFAAAWKRSDVKLASSCFCQPGKH